MAQSQIDCFEKGVLDPLGNVPVYSIFSGATRAAIGTAGAIYGLAVYILFGATQSAAECINFIAHPLSKKSIIQISTIHSLETKKNIGLAWLCYSFSNRVIRGIEEMLPFGGSVFVREETTSTNATALQKQVQEFIEKEAALQTQNIALIAEKADLQSSLQTTQDSLSQTQKQVKQLSETNKELIKQKGCAEKALESAKEAAKKTQEELENKYSQLLIENIDLTQKLSDNQKKATDLEKQVGSLTSEKQKLEKTTETLQETNSRLKTANNTHRTTNQQLQEEIKDLKKTLETAQIDTSPRAKRPVIAVQQSSSRSNKHSSRHQ
jgi:myosin heavy subunit